MHPDAERSAVEHYRRLEAAAPGLLVGLHVVGSAVLEDYRPGQSDLDVVGELSRPATPGDLDALAAAHRDEGAAVEAVYVRAGELNGPVSAVTDGPWAHDGTLHTNERCFQLNPVVWQQLAEHAATLVGERPRPVVDAGEVAAFCRANLVEYWQPLLDAAAAAVGDRAEDEPAGTGTVIWIALGPPRLWHTVRTGEVISKTRAGELAAGRWPDLAEPLADVLAARRGEQVVLTSRHANTAVDLGHRVMADVLA